MFPRASQQESNKLWPGAMLNQLKKKYPGRFDLPSEAEVRPLISALVKLQKEKKEISLDSVSRKRGIREKYARTIECEFTRLGGSMMPRQAVTWLRTVFDPNAHDYPDEGQIKRKVSAFRKAAAQISAS